MLSVTARFQVASIEYNLQFIKPDLLPQVHIALHFHLELQEQIRAGIVAKFAYRALAMDFAYTFR